MTFKINRVLEVVEVHVGTKFHQLLSAAVQSYQQRTRFQTTLRLR